MVIFPMTLMGPNPVFKVTAFLKSNISYTVHFTDSFYRTLIIIPVYRTVPLSMTLSDL